MKQIIRGLLAGALCCTLLLATACGGSGSAQGDNIARGRYLESKFTLPQGRADNFYLQPDGSVNLLLYEKRAEPVMYNTADFTNWQPVEIPWHENLGDETMSPIAYDESGTLYVLSQYGYHDEGGEVRKQFNLYRVGADGSSLEEIPVDWYRAASGSRLMDVDDLKILDNGDFLMGQPADDAIVQYGSDGSFKKAYDINSDINTSFAVSGNTLAILDEGSVRIYDGDSRELENQTVFEAYLYSSRICYGRNDILYIQNNSGLYRLNPGGSLWEKIIDGDLCSMAIPEMEFTGVMELNSGDFYMLVGDDKDTFVILGYHYDPDIAALPEHELLIYALEENTTVRLAAVEYQKLHPETKVNIQLAYDESSATISDQLRALNTELLAGKGPDILILDGMNVEDYIDKGALLDLSEMVEELTASSNLVESVLRTYEKEGRICALPVKYHVPVMIAEETVAAEIETLDDLARYAAENPGRGILGNMRPELLLEVLLPVSAPTWIAGDTIDTEQLSAFLEAAHTIVCNGGEPYYYDEEVYFEYTKLKLFDYLTDMEKFHYAYGRSHVYLATIKGIYGATDLHPLLEPEANLEAIPNPRADSVLTYLPGQQQKCYVPVTITGINVNSAQPERAMGFVKLMFSDSVQYDGGMTTGFAVSVTAQEEEAAIFIDTLWPGWVNRYDTGEFLFAPWAPVELQQQVIHLAQGVENPGVVDETLNAMIINASVGYLTGEKNLGQAIADVVEVTRIYLAE